MFYLLYFQLLIVAALLKLNVELNDLRYPTIIFLCVSFYFNLLLGEGFFGTAFFTLFKSPFVLFCFWGVKKLESKHFMYWAIGIVLASQFLIAMLI